MRASRDEETSVMNAPGTPRPVQPAATSERPSSWAAKGWTLVPDDRHFRNCALAIAIEEIDRPVATRAPPRRPGRVTAICRSLRRADDEHVTA